MTNEEIRKLMAIIEGGDAKLRHLRAEFDAAKSSRRGDLKNAFKAGEELAAMKANNPRLFE